MPNTRLALVPLGDVYAGDRLFDADGPLNRDDSLSVFRLLRARLEALGGFCHTLDVCEASGLEPEVVLFLDSPPGPVEPLLARFGGRPEPWVALYECPAILPRNWDAAVHDQFARILTWADPLVDGSRYLKFNFASRLWVPEPLDVEAAERNLCTLVAGNKSAAHPHELYSARRGAIRWFEERHPEAFDLWGIGWDDPGAPFYPSYRGRIEQKLPVLERYWFTVCFENARGFPGYFTEKLFDCLLARNVPIYWGAENVADHVPAGVFVDMRRFSGFDELYEFLAAIEPDDYVAYLEAARDFLASPASRQFSDEGCADAVVAAMRGEPLKTPPAASITAACR